MQYVLIIKLDSHWLDLRENLEETWGNASFYLNVLHRSTKSPISVFPSTNSGKRSMSTALRTSWLKLVRPWLSYGISHHFVCRSVANSKFTVNNLSRYWTDSLPNNPRYTPLHPFLTNYAAQFLLSFWWLDRFDGTIFRLPESRLPESRSRP